MKQEKLAALLEQLRKLPESEWIEFKEVITIPSLLGSISLPWQTPHVIIEKEKLTWFLASMMRPTKL